MGELLKKEIEGGNCPIPRTPPARLLLADTAAAGFICRRRSSARALLRPAPAAAPGAPLRSAGGPGSERGALGAARGYGRVAAMGGRLLLPRGKRSNARHRPLRSQWLTELLLRGLVRTPTPSSMAGKPT